MYQALTREYRINLSREIGYDPGRPSVSRRRMVAFADAIPSMRIAVDLKVELFRNPAKPWSMNADPRHRCAQHGRAVLPRRRPRPRDGQPACRAPAPGSGYGTKIITSLSGLPGALPELAGASPERTGRPDRLGLGRPLGRLLPRLGRPHQQRRPPSARSLTTSVRCIAHHAAGTRSHASGPPLQAHGGTITAASPPGGGAVFTLALPAP